MERQHPHPPASEASGMQAINVRMAIMAAMARPYSVRVIIWGAGLEMDITGYLGRSSFGGGLCFRARLKFRRVRQAISIHELAHDRNLLKTLQACGGVQERLCLAVIVEPGTYGAVVNVVFHEAFPTEPTFVFRVVGDMQHTVQGQGLFFHDTITHLLIFHLSTLFHRVRVFLRASARVVRQDVI